MKGDKGDRAMLREGSVSMSLSVTILSNYERGDLAICVNIIIAAMLYQSRRPQSHLFSKAITFPACIHRTAPRESQSQRQLATIVLVSIQLSSTSQLRTKVKETTTTYEA